MIRNSTPTELVVEILPPDPVPNEELAVKISVDSADDDGDAIVDRSSGTNPKTVKIGICARR
jgi:hypothetical protein